MFVLEKPFYQSLGEQDTRDIFESLASVVLFESYVWLGVLLWVIVALAAILLIASTTLGVTVWSSKIRDKEVDDAYQEEARIAEHQVALAQDPHHKKLIAAE